MVNTHGDSSPRRPSGAVQPDGAEASCPQTLVVYRGIFSEWGWLLLTIVLAAGAYHITRANPWAIQRIFLNPGDPQSLSFGLPLLAIFPLMTGFKYLHAIFDERYIICEDYVMEVRGMLRWKRHSTRANYIHINGVEIEESLVQRLLGIGDLKIITALASVNNYPIIMEGIADPRAIKDIIQDRTNRKLKEFRGGIEN